jgi:intein/homing endonuclease
MVSPRLERKGQKLAKMSERFELLLKDQSWLLGHDLIENIKPGDEERIQKLLNAPFDNRLIPKTKDDIENPHVHILRIMRDPDYLPFTCRHLLNITILPFQHVILKQLWYKSFPMLIGSRGMGKSFILALYAVLRALIHQGIKIIIVGSAFRQAKVVFEYVEQIWANAPVLRDLCGGTKGRNNREQGPRRDIDRCECIIGDSIIIALPLGDGKKIRGQRANIIIADEFACLGETTLVETDQGLMRIKDSKDKMGSFKVHVGNGQYETPSDLIETPLTDVYRVTTVGGYTFDFSSIHTVMTTKGWKIGQELTTSDYLPFENNYIFPENKIEQDGLIVDEKLGWLMGMLTAEGSINSRHSIQLRSTNRDTVEKVKSNLQELVKDRKVGLFSNKAYEDKRGWKCKEAFTTYCCNIKFRNQLVSIGLERAVAKDKKIPWSILQSPREVVIAYLRGLFDGDGSAFLWTSHGIPNQLGVAFYSVSEQLCQEVQILLSKLGIFCTRQKRRSKISDRPQWMLRLNGNDAHALSSLLDIPRWKEVLSKAISPYIEKDKGIVWDKSRNKWKAEIRLDGELRYLGRFNTKEEAKRAVETYTCPKTLRVKSVEKLSKQEVLYDYRVPEKESFVANCFLQHNTIPPDIYEVVVKGFGAVSQNPVEEVQSAAWKKVLKKLGRWDSEMDEASRVAGSGNQAILSGTASYSFNWFAKYWNYYKSVIFSRGDKRKIQEMNPDREVDEGLDWRDYLIIRMPYELLPPGLMDAKVVASSRAMSNKAIAMMEYGSVFVLDSDGYFKRSLIESCVAGAADNNFDFSFTASLRGERSVRHVIAVDTASERDNFAIVVIAMHADHRRVVYCWTTRKKDFQKRQKAGLTTEQNFFAFAARKIRELMKVFPTERIMMDAMGGGYMIEESLHDLDKLLPGELPIWQVIDPDPKKRKDNDNKKGLHIIEMVQFSDANWVNEANTGLKKDMEDKVLLFPYMDTAMLGFSIEEDKQLNRRHDTLEDAVMEIEAMKDELASIVHTQTESGRDKWDVPKIKGTEQEKKGRMRKDRYSALLMANMGARQMVRGPKPQEWDGAGGWAGQIAKQGAGGGAEYILGEGWGAMPDDDIYGVVVRK